VGAERPINIEPMIRSSPTAIRIGATSFNESAPFDFGILAEEPLQVE
jgi:hypothetical protein